jgi:hypothetical protein
MPTREQTITDAIRIFEGAEYPLGLNVATAWLGIYQTLLWCEPVNRLGFNNLPHIIDADKLRPASSAKGRTWTSPSAWQKRAQALAMYLAEQLRCPVEDVPNRTDLLMRHSNYAGMQRQNTLGIAFAGLVKHVLEKFGSKAVSYGTEIEAGVLFPGVTFPGRSTAPRIDVLAKRDDMPRAIISAKWSLRHDRVNDITNECPVYKAADQRIYRHASRDRLLYYVVTDEYDPARLNKMLDDTCVDGVVHVHKTAVMEVCGLNGRLAQLMDLTDFINATLSW